MLGEYLPNMDSGGREKHIRRTFNIVLRFCKNMLPGILNLGRKN
jgi:hypothetical protein